MSRTRALMADLRRRLGEDAPLGASPPVPRIPPPPARIFPRARRGGDRPGAPALSTRRDDRPPSGTMPAAAAHTTALLGIGHVGTRYATDVVLQFRAELAVSREAVAAVLPDGWFERHGLLPLSTRVRDHREFLLRPDLGRRLDEPSLARLRAEARRSVDVQLILADGLSAVACAKGGVELLAALARACEARGLSVGTPVGARFARVWLEDEIGQETQARVAVILLGERPGLGTGDGLSAYVVHQPRVGKTDGDRNMMSNIHARGTEAGHAARQLVRLIGAMIEQGTSGVALDLSNPELAEARGAYRAPQVRERLVEVP